MLNNPMLIKVGATSLGIIAAVILAALGRIDGHDALSAIQTLVGVLVGSTAIFGGAQSIANAMLKRTPMIQIQPPKTGFVEPKKEEKSA